MSEPQAQPLIARDDKGIPVILGANTRVEQVVTYVEVHGETPEEVHEQLPHLSVEQVEAALAFYESHRQEIDDDRERRRLYVERFEREYRRSPEAIRLKKLIERQRAKRRDDSTA